MNPLLRAALDYAARGWSVIPVTPRGKKPLVPWSRYHTERATPDQIRIWWERWPTANIGVVTGRVSGIVAIDIDANPDPGFLDALVPTGQEGITGSGGRHLLYATGAEIPNRVALRHGIDVRGEGGFIVVPPSVHASGAEYRWERNSGPSPLPHDLLGMLCADSVSPGATDASSQRWLGAALSGTAEGNRNATAARMAGYYVGKNIPIDIITATMRAWNSNNSPPLPDEELLRTIRSVAARAPAAPAETGEAPEFSLVPFGRFMEQFGETETRWAIDGWLPSNTIAFAIAPPGSFKTWMLFDAAVSVASGTPFLGRYKVNEPGPVIVIQQEDFRGTMAERFALVVNSRISVMATEEGVPVPPVLPIFLHLDRELRFSNKKAVAGLREQIQRIRPRLVIIDPLYSAASTDDFMSRTAEQMLSLKAMRDEFGCSFLIAHHTRKRVEDTEREGLWGSQFLNALLETGWQIRSHQGGVIVRRHFKASKDSDVVRLTFDISDRAPHRYEVTEHGAGDGDTIEAADRVLAALPGTTAQIADRTKMHRTTVSRRLRALAKDGLAVRDGKGVYSLPDSL